MTPRRRQPPLFEALGEPPRRLEHGGHATAPAPVPKSVSLIEPRPSPASATGPAAPAWARNRSTVILLLVAILMVILIAVWSLAYRMGHQTGQRSILQHTDPGDAAIITGQNPSTAPGAELPAVGAAPRPASERPGSSRPPAIPAPVAGMPAIAGPDPRKPGFNYLEICPLTWKDAEPAVRFLQTNGVRATAVPLSAAVDPARPKPNDRFLVLVDQPFPSGEGFRAAQAEREQLIAKVRRLGKQFRTDMRGASDFADPMFRLQRGGK